MGMSEVTLSKLENIEPNRFLALPHSNWRGIVSRRNGK
jgi:hypothetical protein